MQRYQKPTNPTPSQQINKFLPIASSLIEALIRSKNSTNIKQAFIQLNKFSASLVKRTQLFAKTLSKIITKKQQKSKKIFFSVLLHAKISNILSKRQKITALKQRSMNQSVGLMSCIVSKITKQKLYQAFQEVKVKSLLKLKRNAFKLSGLLRVLKTIQRRQLADGMRLMKLQGFNLLVKYKRCFVLERFYRNKRTEHLLNAFSLLHEHHLIQQQPQAQQSLQVTIKQLQEQKTTLQSQLSKKKSQIKTNLQPKQTQLSKLQSEFQSMRFSFQLMGQDNQDLKETIVQRQQQLQQNEMRKQFSAIKRQQASKRQFTEGELWKSVFDNLMCYLYKLKTIEKGQSMEFDHDLMIEKLTEPLVSLATSSHQELKQENAVLKDLLESYRKTFSNEIGEFREKSQQSIRMTPQFLNKERKFLLLSLDSLSRWGTTSEVDEMKVALQKMKGIQQEMINEVAQH